MLSKETIKKLGIIAFMYLNDNCLEPVDSNDVMGDVEFFAQKQEHNQAPSNEQIEAISKVSLILSTIENEHLYNDETVFEELGLTDDDCKRIINN